MGLRRLTVLLLAGALLATACGNAKKNDASSSTTTPNGKVATTIDESSLKVHHPINEAGVTDTEIRASVVADITNPLGDDYQAFADGIEAYFDMVNSEGGLYGRDLKVVNVRDDQLANNNQEVQAALSQDNPFAMFVATSLFTGANTLAAAKVPTFGWMINAEWAGPETFFPNSVAHCFTCADPVWPWVAKQAGATKIGLVAYNVPQSADCAKADAASFEKWPVAKVAFTDTSLSFGTVDMSAQVAQMKDKGVDLVITCFDRNGSATLAKEMQKQGLDAPLVMSNAYDQAFVKANAKYFDGSYVTTNFTAMEHTPQPPEMKTFLKWMKKSGKDVKELSLQGWMAAYMFVTGLKLAGPDFTRAKVAAALNAQKDMTAHGLLAPIDWSKDHVDISKQQNNATELDCTNWVKVGRNGFESVFAQGDKSWVCFTVGSVKLDQSGPLPLPTPTMRSFVGVGV